MTSVRLNGMQRADGRGKVVKCAFLMVVVLLSMSCSSTEADGTKSGRSFLESVHIELIDAQTGDPVLAGGVTLKHANFESDRLRIANGAVTLAKPEAYRGDSVSIDIVAAGYGHLQLKTVLQRNLQLRLKPVAGSLAANAADTSNAWPTNRPTFSLDMVIEPPAELIEAMAIALKRTYDSRSETSIRVAWSSSATKLAKDSTRCSYPGGHVVVIVNDRPRHLTEILVPPKTVSPMRCAELNLWLNEEFRKTVVSNPAAVAAAAQQLVK